MTGPCYRSRHQHITQLGLVYRLTELEISTAGRGGGKMMFEENVTDATAASTWHLLLVVGHPFPAGMGRI